MPSRSHRDGADVISLDGGYAGHDWHSKQRGHIKMSDRLQFDEEISRKVEALYLTPDVVAQRCQVLKALQLSASERVLDIGTGPGLLAYDMAASVGGDGRVCGIDVSEDMLA